MPPRASAPDEQSIDDEPRRLRAAIIVTLLALVLVLPMTAASILQGRTDNAIVSLVVGSAAAVLLVLIRRGLPIAIVAHSIAAMVVLPASINTFTSPSPLTTSILALLIAPLIVTFLAGGRSGWVWCGFAVVCYALLLLGAETNAQQWMVALAITTVGLTIIVHSFEVMRTRNEAALTRVRDEATAAADAKTRFLANMSHEIRTPMNGVLGMLGLLLETKLDRVQQDFASTAHASGVALLDLLNDILDFSKIEAGQLEVEVAPLDLRRLVEEVLDQLAVLADEKGLSLVLRYVPRTPHRVQGDAARIRQIVLNLVGNALKFTREGHVLVTVEHEDRDPEPPRFTLAVEDTGIGIAKANQGAIFEHFQQGDMSTTKLFGGTGLGLAIVRELAALMGGEISVRSEVGKGSTFTLSLPMARTSVRASITEPIVRSLEGRRALLVDESSLERSVLRELLEYWGLSVLECTTGAQALTLLEEAASEDDSVEFVLLGQRPDELTSLELTERIKGDPTLAETIVLVLGSVTKQLDAQALKEAGCEAYLKKPVHRYDLMDAVSSAWTRRTERTLIRSSTDDSPAEPDPPQKPLGDGDLRVLVVEDNVVNQKVAQHMLSDLGCEVEVANNGREALDQIEAHRYDLVFMDVQMPEMDGLQATAELRRRQGNDRRLPIVAMTAHALPSDRQLCLDAGMDGYVTKPVRREDLLQAVEEYALGGAQPEVERGQGLAVDASVPCDLHWLRRNYNADDEVLLSLVQMFLDRATELLGLMRANLDADEMTAFGRHAHALKGISGTVRANPLFSLLADSPEAVAASMETIEQTFAELRRYLAQQLDLS